MTLQIQVLVFQKLFIIIEYKYEFMKIEMCCLIFENIIAWLSISRMIYAVRAIKLISWLQ
jgi:hypothetical protein